MFGNEEGGNDAKSIQRSILESKNPRLLPIVESDGDLTAKEAKYHKTLKKISS